MSRRDGAPRGAGGRRRYVADWPRNLARTRKRMGVATLLLGSLVALSVLAFARAGTDGDAARAPPIATGPAALERRDGSWYLAAAPARVAVRVQRVIEGDTLDVLAADGTVLRMRLFGASAPELDQRYGGEAATQLEQLAGREVALVPNVRLEDGLGRELRYAVALDGRSLDAALVATGLARAWDEDGALRDQLLAIEREARDARRGCLWADR